MQTVTYYVLKNAKGEYRDGFGRPNEHPGTADCWPTREAAYRALTVGFRVVKVTRKSTSRKTYNRLWAMRQLVKGRTITNVAWAPSEGVCKLTNDGIRYFSCTTVNGGPESLSCSQGYYLAP